MSIRSNGTEPGGGSSGAPAGDEELAMRAGTDREAFAVLYGRYIDPIHKFCFRRLGVREASEDATSQIFYRALGAIHRYREGSFRSWLFVIAHNVVKDHFRSIRPVEPLEDDCEIVDDDLSPEEFVIARDEQRSILNLLAGLNADQRLVLELRLAGLTGPEIAGVLDRSRGWVNVTQFRAIERMRELMGVSRQQQEDPHAASR